MSANSVLSKEDYLLASFRVACAGTWNGLDPQTQRDVEIMQQFAAAQGDPALAQRVEKYISKLSIGVSPKTAPGF